MKLTDAQRTVLERMRDGAWLSYSPWDFRLSCDTRDPNKKTVWKLETLELIARQPGESYGIFTITPAGIAVLVESCPDCEGLGSFDFDGKTHHCTACGGYQEENE